MANYIQNRITPFTRAFRDGVLQWPPDCFPQFHPCTHPNRSESGLVLSQHWPELRYRIAEFNKDDIQGN